MTELSGDLFEWRADFFERHFDPSQIQHVLKEMKKTARKREIIFALRSIDQGGHCALKDDDLKHEIFQAVIDSNCADYIELELEPEPFSPWKKDILQQIKASGHKAIIAAYNYENTPGAEEITSLVRRCETTGADIPKIAVMTHDRRDILSLLQGILKLEEIYGKRDRIVVGMGREGNISRVAPWLFGSFLTFASSITTSMPGQINPNDLTLIMSHLHTER
ncbi:MAG: type I 3-dehydroquinate dehydratase [Lachnospiraceae bacterium]|nr:type I 3-dehydroquinate dehydratase [Lachnospiraceae bacterium]